MMMYVNSLILLKNTNTTCSFHDVLINYMKEKTYIVLWIGNKGSETSLRIALQIRNNINNSCILQNTRHTNLWSHRHMSYVLQKWIYEVYNDHELVRVKVWRIGVNPGWSMHMYFYKANFKLFKMSRPCGCHHVVTKIMKDQTSFLLLVGNIRWEQVKRKSVVLQQTLSNPDLYRTVGTKYCGLIKHCMFKPNIT